MPTIARIVLWMQVIAAAAVVVPSVSTSTCRSRTRTRCVTDQIALGRQLFSDRRLSRDGSRACASCHDPGRAFSDGRPIAVGVFGRKGRRNAPALINRGYGRAFFWDGRATSLEAQVLAPISDPNEMDLTLEEASTRIGLTSDEISRALASFVRSILSGNSRFDRFVNGDRSALTTDEQRGLQVFRGKGNCTACHVGPNFTDERTHNTGVAWEACGPRSPTWGVSRSPARTPTGARSKRRRFVRSRERPVHARRQPDDARGRREFLRAGREDEPNLDQEIRMIRFTADEKKDSLASFVHCPPETEEDDEPQVDSLDLSYPSHLSHPNHRSRGLALIIPIWTMRPVKS